MSYTRPGWLPPLLQCNGVWQQVLESLYEIFGRDFVQGRPGWRGKRLWWDRRVLPGERFEEGFWHLISRKDPGSGERMADYRRAERLCWCRPVIEHSEDSIIKCWDSDSEGKRVRSYLWIEPEDYVVVLEQRTEDVVFLITAYHLDGESSRRKLRRSYENRL